MAPDNLASPRRHVHPGSLVCSGCILYDNFSEPLDARKTSKAARCLKEVFDAATRETTDVTWFPLRASDDGAYLEAQVGPDSFPREITAKLRFESGGELSRFDFIFPGLSEAPAPNVVGSESSAAPSNVGALVIPGDARRHRRGHRSPCRSRGEARGLRLAFGDLPPRARGEGACRRARAPHRSRAARGARALTWAAKQIVRSAWLLDDYGDLGDREKVISAHRLFVEAVSELGRHFP